MDQVGFLLYLLILHYLTISFLGQLGIGSTQSKNVPSVVSGPWIEINVKDVLLRDGQRSLVECTISEPKTANQETNLTVLSENTSNLKSPVTNG